MRNHAPDIAAMDLFVVPTIGFDQLYAFVNVRLGRRDLVWISDAIPMTARSRVIGRIASFKLDLNSPPLNNPPHVADSECDFG